VEVRGFEPLTS